LVRAAAEAGCDAVKFQTYRTDSLAAPDAPMADYQRANTGFSGSQADLLKRCELGWNEHEALMEECRRCGLLFLSTPFDEPSLDLLCALGVRALKISSGDVTNIPFLQRIRGTQLPVILSTGMATIGETEEAVRALRGAHRKDLVLLHCVSCYPTEPSDCHLPSMNILREKFSVPVGFSDHTTGFDITIAAVAVGANVIEKHVTMDRSLPGPDHTASIEPVELKSMVSSIRRVEAALSAGEKKPGRAELETAKAARKSLHARVRLPAGTIIKEEHLVAMRPGTGLPPSELPVLLGKKLRAAVEARAMITKSLIE
jgi:sialic acid synthase SpsE